MGQFKTAVSTAEVEIWLDYESSVWMYIEGNSSHLHEGIVSQQLLGGAEEKRR
jgi:hypothetical protein